MLIDIRLVIANDGRLPSAATKARAARRPARARSPSLQDPVQPCCSGRDPAIKCHRRPPVWTYGGRQPVSRTSRAGAAFEMRSRPAQCPRPNRSAPCGARIERGGQLDLCALHLDANLRRSVRPLGATNIILSAVIVKIGARNAATSPADPPRPAGLVIGRASTAIPGARIERHRPPAASSHHAGPHVRMATMVESNLFRRQPCPKS
jgi:hypothetical protein